LKQNVFWQREEVADDDVRLLKWTTYDATHVPVDYDGDTPISQVRTLCSRAVLTYCSHVLFSPRTVSPPARTHLSLLLI
jgi:hypothetical protein